MERGKPHSPKSHPAASGLTHQKVNLTDVIARRKRMKVNKQHMKAAMKRSKSVVDVGGSGGPGAGSDLQQLQNLYGGSGTLGDANTLANTNRNSTNKLLSPLVPATPGNALTVDAALRVGGSSVPDLVDLRESGAEIDGARPGRQEKRDGMLTGSLTIADIQSLGEGAGEQNDNSNSDRSEKSEKSAKSSKAEESDDENKAGDDFNETSETFGVSNVAKRTSTAFKVTSASQTLRDVRDMSRGRSSFLAGGRRRSLSADEIDKIDEETTIEEDDVGSGAHLHSHTLIYI